MPAKKKTPAKAKTKKSAVKAKAKPKPAAKTKPKAKSKAKKVVKKKAPKPTKITSPKAAPAAPDLPEISSVSAPKPLSSKPKRVPALKGGLTHKQNLLNDTSAPRLISDITATVKAKPTKRLKIAPINLPIESIDSPDLAQPEIVEVQPAIVKKPPGTTSLLPGDISPTETEITSKPKVSPEGGMFDDILKEVNKNDDGPVYDRNYSQPPEKDISVGDAEDLYSEIGVATSATEISVDDTADQHTKQSGSKQIKTSTSHHHLPIRDRHKKSKYVYVFEVLIILALVTFFFGVLIDAQIIDLGIELPFDFV